MGERSALGQSILDLVAGGAGAPPSSFDALALRVFEHQYAHNAPYRAFCDASSRPPSAVAHWRDIPAYPTAAFKREIVTSFPMERAVMAQLTSGTTSANQRGQIFRDEEGRELVFAANRRQTGDWLFPDLEDGRRCRILILAPSPRLAPSMGMAIGMEQTRVHFGTPDSEFLVGRSGVDVRALDRALREAEASGVPIALVGATSAFVYFLDSCRRKKIAYRLPAGSRLADGGGYRGRFGELTRDGYYALAAEVLGVPGDHCVNVLGMAESATNYFDSVLRERVRGGGPPGPRRKIPPPWTRVIAVSLDDLRPLPHGEVGLLRHFDLANLPTVLAVQADNLGVTNDDGSFEILGRAQLDGGRVSLVPSEDPVGPMGDSRVFRLLEAYVNFTVRFKAGAFLRRSREPLAYAEGAPPDAVASCPTLVDELVASPHDPEARKRAERALEVIEGRPGEGRRPE